MPRTFDLELERRWRERMRQFERSGLSVREFCRSHALREHTFFWWRRALAKRDRARQTPRPIPRPSPPHRARRRASRRRRTEGESSSRAKPSCPTPAFVPVELIAEPLGPWCIEFRFDTCLVRVPTTIDERSLRQAIRVLREEMVGRAVREEAATC